MATSSITKDFTIKDKEAYKRLVKGLEKDEKPIIVKTHHIEEGRKALEKFSFR